MKISDNAQIMEINVTPDELDNYLNELEQIALFVNKGVLDKEFAYQMFGNQFVSVYEYPPIKEYMKKWQDTEKTDFWNQFEKVYVKFVKIQEKRKVIPAIRKFRKIFENSTQTQLDSGD